MATISDVSIINWNKTEAKPVASGLERTICSQGLCGSKTLTVYQRTVLEGRQFDVQAGGDYHLVYVIEAPKAGIISFNGKSHAAEEGAGVLLAPGKWWRGLTNNDLGPESFGPRPEIPPAFHRVCPV